MEKRLALLIGNDHYTDPKLANLAVPSSDVEAFKEVLANKYICDFDDIRVVLNEPFEITMDAIGDFFDAKHRNDLLLFYFSGHGLVDSDGDLHFALKNTRFARPAGNSIPASFVNERLDKCHSRRLLIILDCCHSGAFQRNAKGAGTGSQAITKNTFASKGYAREIITSSSATQLSFEGSEIIGNTTKSVFTHYLVEGLQTGQAAAPGSEIITAEQLYQYAYDKVVAEKPEMTPQRWVYRQEGSLVIARNLSSKQKATLPESTTKLPNELNSALFSNSRFIREHAVDDLVNHWLTSNDPEKVACAEQVLLELKEIERDKDIHKKIVFALHSHAVTRQGAVSGAAPLPPVAVKKRVSTSPQPVPQAKLRQSRSRPLVYGLSFIAIFALVGLVGYGFYTGYIAWNQASEKQRKIASLLDQANREIHSNNLTQKNLDSVADKYQHVLALDPRNVSATQGIEEVNSKRKELDIATLLTQAEVELKSNNLTTAIVEDAVKRYQTALNLEPGNKHALEGITRAAGEYLALAQTAIENKDTVKAKENLDGARALAQRAAHPERQEKLKRLESALDILVASKDKEQRITTLLVQAEILLVQAEKDSNSGNFTTPASDNAIDRYQQVLKLDPKNKEAMQGLKRVAGKYLAWAQSAIDNRDLAKAKDNLDKAQSVFPQHPDIGKLQEKLAGLKQAPAPFSVLRDKLSDGSLGPAMVVLPSGAFMMGSPVNEPGRIKNEGPQHKVNITAFAIGRTEVTFAEYDRFAKATQRKLPKDRDWGRGQRPVIQVSWDDAQAYVAWLSTQTGHHYRLPSEAEWEYAARAGSTTPFYTGTCINTDQVNYDGRYDYNQCGSKTGVYRKKNVVAASLPANSWGLYEMAGNVWEWVQDCYHDNYTGAPLDGSAWEQGENCSLRVFRGGGWITYAEGLRSAARLRSGANEANPFLGFRLARTL